MKTNGNCICGNVKVAVFAEVESIALHPRVCDCDYCQNHSAKITSHPTMKINLTVPFTECKVDKNGDGLAGFYRCSACDSLIFVGCRLEGLMRGAVNAELFPSDIEFGDIVNISPKHLTADEKLKRWDELWGVVFEAIQGRISEN